MDKVEKHNSFSILSSNPLNFYSSLRVEDQVPHPYYYKITYNIILVFTFFDAIQEIKIS
jgi:hypothetical protein